MEQETESGLFIQKGLKSKLPNLDKQDIARYINMRQEAENKLREAEDARDVDKQTEQKRIIDMVGMLLDEDITPDGKQRYADLGWHNARKNVKKRIDEAIEKIRDIHPEHHRFIINVSYDICCGIRCFHSDGINAKIK